MKPKKLLSELGPLLRLGVPLALTQLLFIFMQVVDTYFVGPLGAETLGGSSIGNAVISAFSVVGIGLLSGLDFCIARELGAQRPESARHYLVQGLFLATLMGLGCGFICHNFGSLLTALKVPPPVALKANQYLVIVSWSLWPSFLYIALFRYLQAHGEAITALVVSVLANFLNAFLNWLWVAGHLGVTSLGIRGAAYGTFCSRTFMFIALAIPALYKYPLFGRQIWRFDWKRTRELMQLGLPSGSQMFLEVGVFTLATFLSSELGAEPLSAHQIVLTLASLSFMLPLGISLATAALIGRCFGAGEFDRIRRIGWTALGFTATGMLGIGISFAAFAHPLLRIFTPDPVIVEIGASLLAIVALFQVCDGVQVVATGALRGVGNTQTSMWANLVGHWMIGLPIGYYLCFYRHLGVFGIWVGLSIGLTCVAVTLATAWGLKLSSKTISKN
jgi:MATE family multidrug resistance protein